MIKNKFKDLKLDNLSLKKDLKKFNKHLLKRTIRTLNNKQQAQP